MSIDQVCKCEYKDEETLYKIGLFSQMNKVTIKTLRYYDEVGILNPAHIDEFTGYRYYSTRQLPILHEILALRQMGLTIDEIKFAIEGQSVERILLNKRAELLRKIAEETMKLSQVEYYLQNGNNIGNYNVIVKELPEVIVASMRTIIPNYKALFNILPSMGVEMEKSGCLCAVPEYCFNIYHDGGYKAEDVDVEICEAITEMKEDTEKLKFKIVPKVEKAACVLHKGPYEEFPRAYGAVLEWINNNNFEMDGLPRESYIDGIWNRDSEWEWLTEIQFPIRKRSN